VNADAVLAGGKFHRMSDVQSPSEVSVSFIVPAFNAERTLAQTVETVRAAAPPGSELVIIDDGSLDGTRSLAAELADRLVCRPCQGGAARARNDACRAASGDVFVFVDSDVTVRPEAVAGLLKHLADGADAVYGAYEALPPPEVRNAPTTYKNLIHHFTHMRGATDRASTFWSGFSAIKREAFWAVDGFDPSTTRSADVEDIHLGYRLNSAGFRIVLDPSLQALHHKQYNIRGLIASDLFHRAIPWTKAMIELRTVPLDLNLKRHAIISAGLIWFTAATLPLPLIAGRRAVIVPVVAGTAWVASNLEFLRYVRTVDGAATMLKSGLFHAAFGIYSSPGALLGFGHSLLRGKNRSIRNSLSVDLLDGPEAELDITVAVIVAEGHEAPGIDALPPSAEDWELLVVTTASRLVPIPDYARLVVVPDGATYEELLQRALMEAQGGMLACLDADLVPGDGWLDRVREAAARGDLAVGGSFDQDRSSPSRRASSLTWFSHWRPGAKASWMEEHPPNNMAVDVRAARLLGGFEEPGALLRRLSGFGARPLRFDPKMTATLRRSAPRRRLRVLFRQSKIQGSALVRYNDNGLGLRLARTAQLPWKIVVKPARVVRDALREGTADRTFWLGLPFSVIGLTAREVGLVAGYLDPGDYLFDPTEELSKSTDLANAV
jgi:glycosyltransferase involved in cell wall biosynthesis